MEYYKIISVTGFGGLFELVGSKSDGAIVRSLEDKTTKFVSSRVHNFSHLESIEIFTEGDNVNLVEILQAMEKSDEKLPDEKDAAAVKKYFEKVYPQMDFSRVYASDTKKMVRWFKILKENKIELKLREAADETSEQEEVSNESTSDKKQDAIVKEETSDKKTSAKKVKEEKAEVTETNKISATKEKAEAEKTEDIPKDLKASKKVVKKSKEEASEFVNVKQGEDKAPAKKTKKKAE